VAAQKIIINDIHLIFYTFYTRFLGAYLKSRIKKFEVHENCIIFDYEKFRGIKILSMKIRTKLLAYILSISITIYIVAIGFIGVNFSKIAYENAKKLAITEAQKYANRVKADLDADLSVTRGVARIFEEYYLIKDTSRLYDFLLKSQLNVLTKNTDFLAFATSFEYSAIDSNYIKDYGRLQIGYYRVGNDFKTLHKNKDMEQDDKSSLYYYTKSNRAELLTDPYRDSYTGKAEDSTFMASIAVPILSPTGKFAGLAGVDISMDRFQGMIESIKPFEDSYSFLVSTGGIFVAHPDKSKITNSISSEFPDLDEKFELGAKIKRGVSFSTEYKDVSGVRYFISFVPIVLDKISTPWSIGIAVPLKVIYAKVRYNILFSITIGVIGMILIILIVWYTAKQISVPLEKTTKVLYRLSEGAILNVNELEVRGAKEIDQIGHSVNKLIIGLRKMAEFAEQIGKSNFSVELAKLSDKDVIGEVLINMSKNLSLSLDEDKKRQKLEREEAWIANGIAHLSKILREHYPDFNTFSDDLLSETIKYTDSKMGAVYVFFENGNGGVLRQTASFGADNVMGERIEFRPRQSEIGRAYVSKKTIVLENLPRDFFQIRSGLGNVIPKYVYVIPFVLNEECLGVIEIAELEKLDDFKIQFLERISESIAVTISRLKYNFQTRSMLDDTSKTADKLQAKEDVLNKQLKNMKQVKRAMEIKAKETKNLLDAIYDMAYVATYNMDGRLIDANEALLKLLNVRKEDVLGKYQGAFKAERKVEEEIEFQNFWNDLRAGKTKNITQEIEINEKKIVLLENYTPIFDENGDVVKVLNLIMDITNTSQ